MSMLRIPVPSLSPSQDVERKASTRGKTVSARLSQIEMDALETVDEAAGMIWTEWPRKAVLAHLKGPVRCKRSAPDATHPDRNHGTALTGSEPDRGGLRPSGRDCSADCAARGCDQASEVG
jgi:hypothetical protein